MSGAVALPIVTTLAARALRKLGLAIVPDAMRQAPGPTLAASDIALRVLLERGIPVAELSRPNALPPVGLTELGQRTLRTVGVNPIAGVTQSGTTSLTPISQQALRNLGANPVAGVAASGNLDTQQSAAQRALRMLNVNPVAGAMSTDTVAQSDIAGRALLAVGVNPNYAGGSGTGDVASVTTIAQRALRSLDVNPIAGVTLPADVSTQSSIAQDALRSLGVNPVNASAITYDVIAASDIANRALKTVGVNANDLGTVSGYTGTTYSRSQMAVTVLQKLGVIASDETASSTDLQAAFERLTNVHDSLEGWDEVNWPADQVPSTVSEFYVIMAANLVAPTFGKPADLAAYQTARELVRQVALDGYTAQARSLAKVQSVHEMLQGESMVTWTLATIPDSVSEAYVAMTAAMLAPVFGKTPDMDAATAAKGHVRRVALSGVAAETFAENRVLIVNDELAAEGLANWAVTAIPSYAAAAIRTMVEQDLAATYDRAPNLDIRSAAKAQMRRFALSGPSGEALAEAQVGAVHDELTAEGVASWALTAIPNETANAYVMIAEQDLAPTFGRVRDLAAREAAKAEVRRIVLSGAHGMTIAMARVLAVHDELTSLGLANWSVTMIPAGVADAYTTMVEQDLEPTYGRYADATPNYTPRPTDLARRDAARDQVRRIVLSGANGEALAERQVGLVHDEIVAEGLADWTLASLPTEVGNAYSVMAAQDLAMTYGQAMDPAARAAAKAEVRRVVLSGARAEAVAETNLTQLHNELLGLGLVSGTLAAVPLAVSDAYVDLLEHSLAPVYGLERPDALRTVAMNRIRAVALSGPAGEALAEAKVQAVHERLNAAGLVEWVVTAVPLAFAEDYVVMSAALVAPIYRTLSPDEMQAWDARADAAEARIKRAGFVAMAQERALTRVQNVHDELNALGLVTWTTAAIPSSVAEAYTDVAAAQMAAADDGKPLDPAITAAAFQRVRMVAMTGPAGQALANQAVLDVHEDLDARGRIRWTLFDLPPAAEYPYVIKAAARLATDLGVKADPTWDATAERQLMQIVSVPSANRPVHAAYF